MKKRLSILVAVLLVVCFTGSTVFAQAGQISPMYEHINLVSADLVISNGVASVTGTATAKVSSDITVKVELQKYTNGTWKTVSGGTWTNSTTGKRLVVTGSKSIDSGTYRTYVTATVNGEEGYAQSNSLVY